MDASSIRGWASIHESDMLLIPDASTAFMDPFRDTPTLVMIARRHRSAHQAALPPRSAPHRAAKPKTIWPRPALPTRPFSAPKRNFSFSIACASTQRAQHGFYYIDSDEGRWNSGREEHNLGYRPRYKEGYFPVPPTDHYRICARRWCCKWQPSASTSNAITTKWPPAVSAKSMCRFNTLLRFRRQHDELQIHRRNVADSTEKPSPSCPSRIFRTTARACTLTNRCG